jgi:uncharacterized protein involved in response to NO
MTSTSAAAAVPTLVQHGRWRILSSEAHRLMFFFGALQIVAAMAWWLVPLTGSHAGWHAPVAWTIPPAWAHAWLLLYGTFPFFILGFLMTAGPSWLGAGKMARSAFVPAACAMAAGIVLVYAGLVIDRALVAAGVFVHLAGWLWGYAALIRILATHWNANARYALVIFTFLAIGITGSAVFAVSIAASSYAWVAHALHGAVWFFLLPIFVGVSTRMVPFFSSRVLGPAFDYKPVWARPALIAGVLLHGLLATSGRENILWAVDFPLAAIVLHLAWKWGLAKSRGVRLLSVLHVSLTFLAAALGLYGVLSAAVALGLASHVGLAPLHLMVVGYFASMMLGMVSRVSLGHSGRPLEADTLTWACYLGVLAAALLRVAAELLRGTSAGSPLMMAAALAWLAAFGVWAWRYVPIYLAPRIDAAHAAQSS